MCLFVEIAEWKHWRTVFFLQLVDKIRARPILKTRTSEFSILTIISYDCETLYDSVPVDGKGRTKRMEPTPEWAPTHERRHRQPIDSIPSEGRISLPGRDIPKPRS